MKVTNGERVLLGYRLDVFGQKAQHSLYRPGLALRLRLPDLQTVGGKVSITHRPPLPPINVPGTHFC